MELKSRAAEFGMLEHRSTQLTRTFFQLAEQNDQLARLQIAIMKQGNEEFITRQSRKKTKVDSYVDYLQVNEVSLSALENRTSANNQSLIDIHAIIGHLSMAPGSR